MIFVWSGLGFIVPIAGVVVLLLSGFITTNLNLAQPWSTALGVVITGIASTLLWIFTHNVESEIDNVFIEKATGREIVVRRSAGSFFFIPTRYWVYLMPALAAFFGIVAMFDPPKH
jgi:hypothetical protein